MRHSTLFWLLVILGTLAIGIAGHAAPSTVTAAVSATAKPYTLPDYGGRESVGSAVAASGSGTALSPLGQAWRAFEALAIVLALVIGGMYALKRSGLIGEQTEVSSPRTALKPSTLNLSGLLAGAARAKPAPLPETVSFAPWLKILGTQTLPGTSGTTLHLVTLAGKTLLLGANSQSVTVLTELDGEWEPETEDAPEEFASYLTVAQDEPEHMPSETELLLSETTMRLRAIIARSAAGTMGQHA